VCLRVTFGNENLNFTKFIKTPQYKTREDLTASYSVRLGQIHELSEQAAIATGKDRKIANETAQNAIRDLQNELYDIGERVQVKYDSNRPVIVNR
jgi:hypothetical protein